MRCIKLSMHFFEDDKLKAIRSQKDGDIVILLYIMLINVAVKSDADGQLMLCEDIPYDDKILSSILNLPLATVKSGLELLTKFGLLTVANSIFSLVNYDEYADVKTIRERRQNADRQARFKEKQAGNTIAETTEKSEQIGMVDSEV
jgi:predicted phage replisome organizer